MVLNVSGVVQRLKDSRPVLDLVAKSLGIRPDMLKDASIIRKSIDARKKNDIRFVYNVQTSFHDTELEARYHSRSLKGGVTVKRVEEHQPYQPIRYDESSPIVMGRPVVVGCGPAGLFAAYTLACSGLRPIVVEMGPMVERRANDLMKFWKEKKLTPNSNGVFGEGGAGAFSDGKLTTRTSSPYHRFVHDTLIDHGAKPSILYESRAHVGTDKLRKIITRFSRDAIAARGGTFLYNTRMAGLQVDKGCVTAVHLERMPLVDEKETGAFLRPLPN